MPIALPIFSELWATSANEVEAMASPPCDAPGTMTGNPDGQFPETRWTMVLRAKEGTEISSQRALAELCEIYWYPLYAFARRGGKSKEEAEDLTQGLFESLISRSSFEKMDIEGGRLRSFLIRAMKYHLADKLARETAGKRGAGVVHLAIDFNDAESRYLAESRDDLSPDKLFDRRWALALLRRSLDRLGDHYEQQGKGELFQAIKGFLEWSPGEAHYDEIGSALGKSAAAIRQAVYNLRLRYRRFIEEEVGHTVVSSEERRGELEFLLAALRE